ncbi:hypothetical protein ABZ847_29425 [Streptomyces bauhiniae]
MTAPAIAPGTRISLRAGEWVTHEGVIAEMYVDLRLVEVAETHPLGLLWIHAHGLDCRWESVNCPAPWCIRVAVPPDTLRDAANR